MQEVSIALEAIGILAEIGRDFELSVEIGRLFVRRVVTLSALKSVKNSSVVINNFSQVLDAIGPIQRIVSVKASRIRCFLCV